MATIPARVSGSQSIQYLRAPIAFGDGVGGIVQVGTIPAKSIVLRTYVVITTAFNGTTNTISIGTVASNASYGTGISTATAGVITGGTALATATTVNPTSDTSVIATHATTVAATAGAGYAIVEYLPVE